MMNNCIPDWIVAVSTVFYVIVTIFIMYANYKANKLTKEQIKEGKEQLEKQQRLAIRPYLNLYVAREGEKIDDKHYSINLDESDCENERTISIRNIGNGSAKDIVIYVDKQGKSIWRQSIPVRNGFLLVNRQYVIDIFYFYSEKIIIGCEYTDMYDNHYEQKMEIVFDTDKKEIFSHTYNPEYKN